MMLSKEEREKFVAYLEQDAEQSELLAKQLGDSSPMARKLRAEATAAKIVAARLRPVIDEVLG